MSLWCLKGEWHFWGLCSTVCPWEPGQFSGRVVQGNWGMMATIQYSLVFFSKCGYWWYLLTLRSLEKQTILGNLPMTYKLTEVSVLKLAGGQKPLYSMLLLAFPPSSGLTISVCSPSISNYQHPVFDLRDSSGSWAHSIKVHGSPEVAE